MAELAAEVLPPGVLNVVCGDRDTGRLLIDSEIPRLVSITGSVRAACRSPRRVADLKRVHLELGGKAPVVVFDDADIEAAAEAIAVAGYFNAGQDCTAATRVLAGAAHLRRLRRRADRAGARHQDRPARRRGRPLRGAQQRQPARPRQRVLRPAARPRVGHGRRAPCRG
jgi:acyl-CoA reductase-like NAD-dependent aldehyde dehydrogenase